MVSLSDSDNDDEIEKSEVINPTRNRVGNGGINSSILHGTADRLFTVNHPPQTPGSGINEPDASLRVIMKSHPRRQRVQFLPNAAELEAAYVASVQVC